MFGRATVTDALESMRTDDVDFGVFLVVLGVTFFPSGCTVGQALASDSLVARLWAVPLLGSYLTSVAILVDSVGDA